MPEPKMSIGDAVAHHCEPIRRDVLDSYLEFGEPAPTLSPRFELVEIEVPAVQRETGSRKRPSRPEGAPGRD